MGATPLETAPFRREATLAGVVLALMLTGGAVQEPFQEAFVAWSKRRLCLGFPAMATTRCAG